MDKEKDFYKKLKTTLQETTKFPTEYLYKFIVPSSIEKVSEIEAIFDSTGAVINTKPSKTGKYTSISISVKMDSPDDIIDKYKEVSKVEGLISL